VNHADCASLHCARNTAPFIFCAVSSDRDLTQSFATGLAPSSSTGNHQPERGRRVDQVPLVAFANGVTTPRILIGERAHRLYVLKPDNIDYIAARGNYVTFHADAVEYISRDGLGRLAALLFQCGFVRIERSLLVNVQAIAYAQRSGRGTYTFTLASGACLRSGPKYRAQILRVLPFAQRVASRG
jgi:DNA-binding LytR/AlgR family response regulator